MLDFTQELLRVAWCVCVYSCSDMVGHDQTNPHGPHQCTHSQPLTTRIHSHQSSRTSRLFLLCSFSLINAHVHSNSTTRSLNPHLFFLSIYKQTSNTLSLSQTLFLCLLKIITGENCRDLINLSKSNYALIKTRHCS